MMGFLLNAVRQYLLQSTVHGLKYLAIRKCHWTERLLWGTFCVVSWYGAADLINASRWKLEHDAISFAVETSDSEWNTEFPAIHVCEHSWIENRSLNEYTSYDIAEVYKQIIFFRGQSSFVRNICSLENGTLNPECPAGNLYDIAYEGHTKCEDMILNCAWNGQPFQCCNEFLPLQTEIGLCYSINSLQTKRSKRSTLSFVSNVSTGPGRLSFEAISIFEAWWTSRDAVPLITSGDHTATELKPGYSVRRWITAREETNAEGVREVSVAQRRCRFPDEALPTTPPALPLAVYSHSACVTRCRLSAQRRLCGCVSHQAPAAVRSDACGLKGLLCLDAHFLSLSALRRADSRDTSKLYCRCLPSCHAQKVDIVREEDTPHRDGSTVFVETLLAQLPNERFKRYVVRSTLDLVVSMGASVSLFFGASLLSFVELVHHFTLRLYGDWQRTK